MASCSVIPGAKNHKDKSIFTHSSHMAWSDTHLKKRRENTLENMVKILRVIIFVLGLYDASYNNDNTVSSTNMVPYLWRLRKQSYNSLISIIIRQSTCHQTKVHS